MEWINFLANHRHFNYEFILIAQNDRMLDRQIRGLLEYDMKHRALKNWNLAMALLSLVCKGIFHCVEYWYPCKIKTSTHLMKFKPKIANCYDTMALFNFKEDKEKTEVEKPVIKTRVKSNLANSFFDRSKIKEVIRDDKSA